MKPVFFLPHLGLGDHFTFNGALREIYKEYNYMVMPVKENNLKVDQKNIIHCDFNQDYAYFATKELLKSKNRPDAIFTISDRMAIGAMIAIKERGLKMPTDIGLIGFNNEPMLSLLTPTISSIEQPMFEIGKMAAKIFIERLHSEESAITTEVLKPRLIIRESSKRIFN